MSTNTVRLHRVLRAPPERIYRAFLQTTVSLKKVSVGTEESIVQEGIPGAIPTEACYLGWQESLTLLAQLVEAEIQG
jgi:hypothetical protein